MSTEELELDDLAAITIVPAALTPPTDPSHGTATLPLYHRINIPEYLHRAHIHTHYRAFYTFSMCTRSLFSIHNDTGNVWTHLLGGILFLGASGYVLGKVVESYTLHYIIFALYLTGALLSMMLSATFHLYTAHSSERVYKAMLYLDYMGVSAFIVGSFFPAAYVVFACHPWWRLGYMFSVSAVSVVGFAGPLFDGFRTEKYRMVRVGVYVVVAVVSMGPFVHAFVIRSRHIPHVGGLMGSASLYGIGVLFYLGQFPERWWPGRFDVWGHSHQIWHIACLAAAVTHFVVSVLLYIDYRRGPEKYCL